MYETAAGSVAGQGERTGVCNGQCVSMEVSGEGGARTFVWLCVGPRSYV